MSVVKAQNDKRNSINRKRMQHSQKIERLQTEKHRQKRDTTQTENEYNTERK